MSRRAIAAALLLTFTMSACRTWAPIEEFHSPVPDALRVELASGERAEVMDARMEGDILVGRLAGEETPVRIPLSQIVAAEAGRMSAGRTALLVLGVGVLFVGVLAGISFANGIGPIFR